MNAGQLLFLSVLAIPLCLEKVLPEKLKLVVQAFLEVVPQVDTEVTSRIMNDLRKISQSLLDLPDGAHLE